MRLQEWDKLALKINSKNCKTIFNISAHVIFFFIENKKLFTCINESTAVVECAKVRPRKREKSMKFAEVIFKPWPCKY